MFNQMYDDSSIQKNALTPMLDNLSLVEKLSYLEEENHQLRELLNNIQNIDKYLVIKKKYGLGKSPINILLMLYAHKNTVTRESLLQFFSFRDGKERCSAKVIDVFICYIRKAVGKDAIIANYGIGYYLSNEFRHELDTIFYEEHQRINEKTIQEGKDV